MKDRVDCKKNVVRNIEYDHIIGVVMIVVETPPPQKF